MTRKIPGRGLQGGEAPGRGPVFPISFLGRVAEDIEYKSLGGGGRAVEKIGSTDGEGTSRKGTRSA